jgi:ABC-type transport system substrate-binding protein
MAPNNVSSNLIVNRDAPPFQNPDLRRATALSLDRKAFIDILSDGQGNIGGVMQPPPGGVWGMPPDVLQTLPGYGPDIQKNRAEARQIMQTLGYGPDNRLKIKVSTRNTPFYRDPAVILIDQLKEVYIDASSKRSTRRTGTRRSCARTTRLVPILRETRSTTPTRIFTRIMPAVRKETTTGTVIPRWTS